MENMEKNKEIELKLRSLRERFATSRADLESLALLRKDVNVGRNNLDDPLTVAAMALEVALKKVEEAEEGMED